MLLFVLSLTYEKSSYEILLAEKVMFRTTVPFILFDLFSSNEIPAPSKESTFEFDESTVSWLTCFVSLSSDRDREREVCAKKFQIGSPYVL
ncbi:hypothetical protein Hanom_Chr16g01415911 [Helianthus anomalus]